VTNPRQVLAGRYRLDERLASGGMGVVWKGWDERLERAVAVKQIRLQPGLSESETNAARDRAMREARITARLHHPGAVPIYDVVEHDGQPCLIMQFLPSVSLQEELRTRHTLPAVDVARMGSELAAALTAAHRVGIVHRDVKPGNVLIAEDGSVKLTDFGISHALGDVSLTSTGMVTGTPAFLAPEVARGQSATYASDVYSLGSTLYTATEGHPPVEHDDNAMAVLHRVASGDLTPPRRSGPLTPLLQRMLDPDPNARPSMQAVWSALSSLHRDLIAADRPTGPAPTVAVDQPRRRQPVEDLALAQTVFTTRAIDGNRPGSRSRRAILLFAALGAVAAVAIAVIYFLPRGGGGSGTTGTSTLAASSTRKKTGAASDTRPRSAVTSSSGASPRTPSSSSPSSRSPSSGSQSTTSTSDSSSATSSGSSPGAPSNGSTNTQLAQAVTDYYALMPNNVNAGWSRLTPSYQRGHAGGFSGYKRFWAAIQTVSTSNVTGQPPDSASATITYHYKDGRTVVERTRFGFVREGGQLLISESSV
jgi:serine/threonine protein kinase